MGRAFPNAVEPGLQPAARRVESPWRNAFTLVELMVVVTLIGIMIAMIIPEMRGTYEDALLRSTSREVINALNLAYSRAVSFSQTHRVRFEPASGRYVVERRVHDHGREAFVALRDVAGGEGRLDTRVTIEFRAPADTASEESIATSDEQPASVDEEITFYPDGTADAREIRLQDRQGFRLLLRVNPTTARVRIVDEQSERR